MIRNRRVPLDMRDSITLTPAYDVNLVPSGCDAYFDPEDSGLRRVIKITFRNIFRETNLIAYFPLFTLIFQRPIEWGEFSFNYSH